MNAPESLEGRNAVVTGGTDGIGAATALRLRQRGADVMIIGRSREKAEALVARAAALPAPGSLRAVVADVAEMAAVETVVDDLSRQLGSIDLLVHAVGILIPYTAHTTEGIEKDFAVSYLSRFVFLETAAQHQLLHPATRMINIAASAPKIPRVAQVEFADLNEVEARVGMRSHGQAQLANDLLTAQAPARYGITAIGYGPGAVRTNIRRELPTAVRVLLAPVFSLATRTPDQVAEQLVDLLSDPQLGDGTAHFFTRKGAFVVSGYVADAGRQRALLTSSTALVAKTRQRAPESEDR